MLRKDIALLMPAGAYDTCELQGWNRDGTNMELSRLTVDLVALSANYQFIAGIAPHVAAVVKANGYGLGVERVAQTLRQANCEDFFVATLQEGIELRAILPNERIYVFSGILDDDDAMAMVQNDLTPVLNDAEQVRRWQPYAHVPVAIQVDTGMNRLGFTADSIDPEMFASLKVGVLLSHLANADDPQHPMNAIQIQRFKAVAALFPAAKTSFGNSGGVLLGVTSDLARPGIALYGGNPFSNSWNPMRRVATLEARVLALRTLGHGEPVGYEGTYKTDGETCVAVLGIGYGDGIPRQMRNAEAAYHGERLPIIGRISMDMMHIDASAVAHTLLLGDWVEIFGETIGVEEVATWANTISYEILAGIGHRVRRRYIGD